MTFNFDFSAVSGGAPFVTLSSLGISFNSVSISKLGNPEKVIVGFDEEHCALGIRAYRGEPNKAYEFASRVKQGWIKIGCKDFIKYLQSLTALDFSTAKKYVASYDGESETLIVMIKGVNIENTRGDSE
ncbi:MAG: hypothetical protein FWE40_08600 [Oscillospiraceae bacterium]|nr:hypothetical protein [Oscillospiraceae bacterium]